MARRMPLDPAFVEDCCYLPGGLLIDEVLEVDRELSRVRVRMPTHAELPITREQRVHPLRHLEGWVGYGGAIHKARFKNLAPPGAPIVIECRATSVRRRSKSIVARYDLRFLQEDREIYEGDQTAMWIKVEEGDAAPS